MDCVAEKHDPAATAPSFLWQHAAKEPRTTPPAVKPTSAKVRKKAGINSTPIPAPARMDATQRRPQRQKFAENIMKCGQPRLNWATSSRELRRWRCSEIARVRPRLVNSKPPKALFHVIKHLSISEQYTCYFSDRSHPFKRFKRWFNQAAKAQVATLGNTQLTLQGLVHMFSCFLIVTMPQIHAVFEPNKTHCLSSFSIIRKTLSVIPMLLSTNPWYPPDQNGRMNIPAGFMDLWWIRMDSMLIPCIDDPMFSSIESHSDINKSLWLHLHINLYQPIYIHKITSHHITLHCVTLHDIHDMILHFLYIALHYLTLHYITLHYLTLHTYIHTSIYIYTYNST